jgi:PAS domain S-box-containing protein/diguanylate cyclase (GGDEF)-like protein
VLGIFTISRAKAKIILSLLLISILIIIGFYSLSTYQKNLLIDTRFEQLVSLREGLKAHINSYQEHTKKNLYSLSINPKIINAASKIGIEFNSLKGHDYPQVIDKGLINYYKNHYLNRVTQNIPKANPLRATEFYIPKSNTGRLLQKRYITLSDSTNYLQGYSREHDDIHIYLYKLLISNGFYDLFLIDPSGNIIYSVMKEADFATNLLTGPYKDTGLSDAFKKSSLAKEGQIFFSSFFPYEPSFNVPAAFLAMPIYNAGKYLGSIAIQLPIENINNIMTFYGNAEQAGLGKSGEAYIVGSDLTMRNDSRFLSDLTGRLVRKLHTTIGIQEVDTLAVKAGFNGSTSTSIVKDYRDITVLSAYTPFNLFGESSVLLAEIDQEEVFKDANSAVSTFIILITTVLITLLTAVILFFEKLIVAPIRKINHSLTNEIQSQEQQVIISQSLLNEYKRAVDLSALVSKADKKGIITYVNDAFCEISGYSRDELIGKNHRIIKSTKNPRSVFSNLWKTISTKKTWKGILCNRRKDGTNYYVSTTIVPLLHVNGTIKEYISIRTDISEIFYQQQKIMMQTTDVLTKLPNWQKFIELLAKESTPLIAIINIDRFSEINDYYGHTTGDKVLIRFSEVLQEFSTDEITLFRLAGDEFSLLATNNFPHASFQNTCEDIFKYLDKEPFVVDDNELIISATIGIAGSSNNAYLNAGMALRVAKESHQALVFYNKKVDFHTRHKNNILWTAKIKQAISEDRVALFVQPIVNTSTGLTNKYECLIRIIEEDGTEVSPFYFLEIAKHARLYSKLTTIIIKKSFDFFSKRTDAFSINLTIEDINNQKTVNYLKKRLVDSSIAKRLIIEIVESEGIENYEDVSAFIVDMKSLGCAIAIDDFGTGYSNFEYLIKLDPDYLKIDGSIIKNITHDDAALRITKLIADFSKSMNFKTIAEFVCDKHIADSVKNLGIDYMQGYEYGKPKNIKDLN